MRSFRDVIIRKKWGYEYLTYENKDVALWVLHINPKEQTSMHCHTEKTTGLVCFDGEIRVDFLADYKEMVCFSKVMIRRGLFHQTTCVSETPAIVLEIESPNKKHDLLRLDDKYGRENSPYEGISDEIDRNDSHLWIDANVNVKRSYSLHNKKIEVEPISDIDQINSKKDDDLVMLLSGGLFKKISDQSLVSTKCGDVGFGRIMKQVSRKMHGVCPNTIILTIPNEQK